MSAIRASAIVSTLTASATKRFDFLVPSVLSQSQLPIGGARWHQSPARPCGKHDVTQEDRDCISAAVPGRAWWHRDRCVVGEHSHHGADIRAFPCFHEAIDDLTQAFVSEGSLRGLLAYDFQ
jgi:hypothetical protein